MAMVRLVDEKCGSGLNDSVASWNVISCSELLDGLEWMSGSRVQAGMCLTFCVCSCNTDR
jgi:hypothetical protein